ncbi:DUF1285 domain-containing protein [Gammaproteobacteria bacterium]|jgi:hypothetical protein|nr:DUF1285 domain-containing protein [Gammaproteobacteria bacterium]MDC0440540.1 DUF1285 domain-containing protein [Gammaproteobacteria bacterium]MDC0884364.1 DUF1285 domain-containing protein [Gammaproteobacteria bacterium]
MDFSDLLQSVNSIEEKYPPVHLWNPDLCEGVEMKIDREGNWFYQNSIIGRDKLKILFSRILKLEEGKYFLVTPVEKVPVTVDLAPYMIVDYEVDSDYKNIILKTNLDLSIPLDNEHRLELKNIGDEHIPFVHVRNNIEGFISRSVYYSLIEIALKQDNGSSDQLTLRSFDCDFNLGQTI